MQRKAPATPAAPPTSPSLLDALTDDCVALVVAALPLPSVLLSFVPLSRRCAELAEAPGLGRDAGGFSKRGPLDEAEVVRICAHLADLNSTLNIRVVPSGR